MGDEEGDVVDVRQLRHEKLEYQRRQAELEQLWEEANDTIARRDDQIAQLQRRVKELEEISEQRLEDLRMAETVEEELSVTKESLFQTRSRLTNTEHRLSSTEQELELARTELLEWMEEMDSKDNFRSRARTTSVKGRAAAAAAAAAEAAAQAAAAGASPAAVELERQLSEQHMTIKTLQDRLDEMTSRNERLQNELELLCNTRERIPSSANDFIKARPKLLPTHSLADELGALDIMAAGPPEPAPPAAPPASAPAGAQLVETVESLQMQLADRDKTIDHLRQLMSELRTELLRALGDAIAADKELQQVYSVKEQLEEQLHAFRLATQRARMQRPAAGGASNGSATRPRPAPSPAAAAQDQLSPLPVLGSRAMPSSMPARARSDSMLSTPGNGERGARPPPKPPKPANVPLLNHAREEPQSQPQSQQQPMLKRSSSISMGIRKLGNLFS